MTTKEELIQALEPLARCVAETDLTRVDAAEAALNEALPLSSLDEVRRLLLAANEEGWLTPRRATDTLRFGRLAKPSPELHGMSVDVVDMQGAGPGHTHPNGEASICFALEGDPRFMHKPEGWVVAAAGSHHVPTVTDGRMLIAYFLPDGAMEWD